MVPAHDVGQYVFMPQPVLQRQHQGLRPHQVSGGAHGLLGVKRFDQHDHQINRCQTSRTGAGQGAHHLLALRVAHHQALAVDGVHLGRVAVDQNDLVARFGQRPANGATQGAGAQYSDFQNRLLQLVGAGLWCSRKI